MSRLSMWLSLAVIAVCGLVLAWPIVTGGWMTYLEDSKAGDNGELAAAASHFLLQGLGQDLGDLLALEAEDGLADLEQHLHLPLVDAAVRQRDAHHVTICAPEQVDTEVK